MHIPLSLWQILLMIVSAIALVLLGRWAMKRCGVLDRPRLYADVKRRYRIPMMQWIPLFMISCLFLLVVFGHDLISLPLIVLVGWWALLVAMTTRDEYIPLSPRIRFVCQILIAYVSVVLIDIPFPLESLWLDIAIAPWILYVMSIVWIMFCLNAINWIDGVSGLASGTSAIWLVTIVLLSLFVVIPLYPDMTADNEFLLHQTVMVAGIVWWLALIYAVMEAAWWWLLRDPGTYFLAFTLAYVSLVWWAKIGTLVVTLSLPLFDAIRVGINRLFVMKKNPTKGDYTHIHHRLLSLGWTKGEVRAFVWLWSVVMMILVLIQWPDQMNKVIIFLLAAILFFGVNIYLYRIKKIPLESFTMKKQATKQWNNS